MRWYLGPRPEPVEMTWGPGEAVQVEWSLDREWWNERIAYRAKVMG